MCKFRLRNNLNVIIWVREERKSADLAWQSIKIRDKMWMVVVVLRVGKDMGIFEDMRKFLGMLHLKLQDCLKWWEYLKLWK